MFTGLIEATGTLTDLVVSPASTRVTIASSLASRLHTGDSIAVNGVCLTALDISSTHFSADLAAETVARTTLTHLRPGDTLNLELPTPAGSPLGGHVVQGHVDGVATLTALQPAEPGSSDWRLHIQLPDALLRYVVPQGSITIDGISLTVAALHGNELQVAIIPHTYTATRLHTLRPGTLLNIETDVLARYAEQQHNPASTFTLTTAYLLANGY